MSNKKYGLVVLGSGPGGYVAAIRGAQVGLKTAIIEKDSVGGVCLNIGCIPTKTIINYIDTYNKIKKSKKFGIFTEVPEINFAKIIDKSRSVANRLSKGVEFLLKKNNVDIIRGTGFLEENTHIKVRNGVDEQIIEFDNLILATGSSPKSIPNIAFDGKFILSSNDALLLKELPEHIVIIGGGVIGIEFAYIWASVGVKVSIIEMMEHILPAEDEEMAEFLAKELKKMGVKIYTSHIVNDVSINNGKVTLSIKKIEGDIFEIVTDKVLLSIGRKPNLECIDYEKIGIQVENGFVVVDSNYQTTVSNIFAIGDIINTPQLAHVASFEGIRVVEFLKGHQFSDKKVVPACVYSSPQYASVSVKDLDIQPEKIKTVKFPYQAIGKAIAIDDYSGFVKLSYDAITKKIVSAKIIGPEATELIGYFVIAIDNQLTIDKIGESIFAHPTLSEIIKETAELSIGFPIHIPKG